MSKTKQSAKAPRTATIHRDTTETQIQLMVALDGTGIYKGSCGCGFFDHMLELFCRHGRFDITLDATGDTHVDYHHLIEDLGITLGRAFQTGLGDMRGIVRYGSFLLPMDEALILVGLDISGRAYLGYALEIPTEKVGDFDTELVEEFFLAFTRGLGATLHLRQLSGKNSHHIIEATFKGFARALKDAVAIDEKYSQQIPSSKGTIL